jgi:FKBP-type peptidyl-prolyl cis-trans isomerase FklB
MKKTSLLIVTCFAAATTIAQTTKPATGKPAPKPATAKPATAKPATGSKPGGTAVAMKSSVDSFSYAIGLSIANFYKQQGVTGINNQLVLKALTDAKNGKPVLNDEQANMCIMNYMQEARSQKSSGTRKAGQAFLAQNKGKAGVVTLPSGLQYQVLQEGTGPKPTPTDQVKCHYVGSFIDGQVFESSYTRNEPATFQVGGVIRGWTEALQLMPVGSKWKLFIPSELGYGDGDNGPIAGGSTLIFEVELLEIVKPQSTQPAQPTQPTQQ